MKKSLFLLNILLCCILIFSSCKTKQLVEDTNIDNELNERKELMEDIANQIGLDGVKAAEMVTDVLAMDKKMMDILANSEDVDARRNALQQNKMQRKARMKAAMTDEQYSAYLKELYRRTKDKTPPSTETSDGRG